MLDADHGQLLDVRSRLGPFAAQHILLDQNQILGELPVLARLRMGRVLLLAKVDQVLARLIVTLKAKVCEVKDAVDVVITERKLTLLQKWRAR